MGPDICQFSTVQTAKRKGFVKFISLELPLSSKVTFANEDESKSTEHKYLRNKKNSSGSQRLNSVMCPNPPEKIMHL